MIDSLKAITIKNPGLFGIWAASAINLSMGINEIAIVGKKHDSFTSKCAARIFTK